MATSTATFCKVIGIVKSRNLGSPNLEFEVNLPAAWNRRALQMGGSRYDGSLVTALTQDCNQAPNSDPPLKQGYVTLGSDGGHKGKPGFDGTFWLDGEALMNYGKQSVKKAHDAAARRIMTGWSPITPRITLRCCTWDRSTWAGSVRRRRRGMDQSAKDEADR